MRVCEKAQKCGRKEEIFSQKKTKKNKRKKVFFRLKLWLYLTVRLVWRVGKRGIGSFSQMLRGDERRAGLRGLTGRGHGVGVGRWNKMPPFAQSTQYFFSLGTFFKKCLNHPYYLGTLFATFWHFLAL
jgi:hypothetical protein